MYRGLICSESARARKKYSGKRRGFSLVEVLVALVFISFGLFGVVDLFINITRNAGREEKQMRAGHLARGYLEQVQASSYADLEAKIDQSKGGSLFDKPETSAPLDSDFSWNGTLSRESGAPAKIRVVVTVSWKDMGAGTSVKEVGYVFAQ